MIIINLKGGLGNQMFQYACGRALALRNIDPELFVDIRGLDAANKVGDIYRPFSLANFNIQARVASAEQAEQAKNRYGIISKVLRQFRTKILRQFYVGYICCIAKQKGIVFLDGFFQTEKYFADQKNAIRKDLTLKTPLSPIAKEWEEKIKKDEQAVAVHVRRGDYPTHKDLGGIATEAYYQKAASILLEKIPLATFYVFSDDIAWTKDNLYLPGTTFYVDAPSLQDFEELTLMSKCKHNIIANSSFSWWGAWLNNNPEKIVIAPSRWSNLHEQNWYKDIIPRDWVRV